MKRQCCFLQLQIGRSSFLAQKRTPTWCHHRTRSKISIAFRLTCNFEYLEKAQNDVSTFSDPKSQFNTSLTDSKVAHLEDTKFDWYNQWYPLAFKKDLDSKKPNPITILSKPLVVWRDKNRSWNVFHDRCPHRFAALSEGRIDPKTGLLECGYHGWQFSKNGSVSHIPQAECDNQRTFLCAKNLPVTMRNGLLFVWMGNDLPDKTNEFPTVNDVRAKYRISSFSREIPLSFTTLLQNVLDPAHIHFAHHGQIGNRDLATTIPIRILEKQDRNGFMADYYDGKVRVRFRPPTLVEIVTLEGLSFSYYAVPVSKQVVRTFGIRGAAYAPLFRIPDWLDHIRRNDLLEGDLELMMTQEREMSSIGGTDNITGAWNKYALPSNSDLLIIELRKWMKTNAPARECDWYHGTGSELITHKKDRLRSHTIGCLQCREARRNLKVFEHVLGISFTLLFLCTIQIVEYRGIFFGVSGLMLLLRYLVIRTRNLME